MAMTAWSAKFVTSSICLSVNGRTSCAVDGDSADQLVLLEHRHAEHSAKPRALPRVTGRASDYRIGGVVANMDALALSARPLPRSTARRWLE